MGRELRGEYRIVLSIEHKSRKRKRMDMMGFPPAVAQQMMHKEWGNENFGSAEYSSTYDTTVRYVVSTSALPAGRQPVLETSLFRPITKQRASHWSSTNNSLTYDPTVWVTSLGFCIVSWRQHTQQHTNGYSVWKTKQQPTTAQTHLQGPSLGLQRGDYFVNSFTIFY